MTTYKSYAEEIAQIMNEQLKKVGNPLKDRYLDALDVAETEKEVDEVFKKYTKLLDKLTMQEDWRMMANRRKTKIKNETY